MRSATARSQGARRSTTTRSKAKGFTEAKIAQESRRRSPSAFDIKFAFNKWTLGEEFCRKTLKITRRAARRPSFDLLAALGFSKRDIEAANIHVCGAMTLEGAPHLKAEH